MFVIACFVRLVIIKFMDTMWYRFIAYLRAIFDYLACDKRGLHCFSEFKYGVCHGLMHNNIVSNKNM